MVLYAFDFYMHLIIIIAEKKMYKARAIKQIGFVGWMNFAMQRAEIKFIFKYQLQHFD